MNRKLMVGLAVALVLVLALSAVALAQGRGPNAVGSTMRSEVGPNGQSMQRNFVDEDGDGVCDNCLNEQGMNGPRFEDNDGDGTCDHFVDADGDGINDNAPRDGSGEQHGRGGSHHGHRVSPQGRSFGPTGS